MSRSFRIHHYDYAPGKRINVILQHLDGTYRVRIDPVILEEAGGVVFEKYILRPGESRVIELGKKRFSEKMFRTLVLALAKPEHEAQVAARAMVEREREKLNATQTHD